jgi:hypothetical protein
MEVVVHLSPPQWNLFIPSIQEGVPPILKFSFFCLKNGFVFSLEDVQQLRVGVYIMFVEVILQKIEEAVAVVLCVSPDEEKKEDRREVAIFNQEKGSAQHHLVLVLAAAVVHCNGHRTTKFVFFQCPTIYFSTLNNKDATLFPPF